MQKALSVSAPLQFTRMFALTFALSFALAFALLSVSSVGVAADNSDSGIVINPPAEGSVTEADGLDAWSRIYQVASHPRCANCHTGASDRPMWSGPSYGKTRPHGMNIRAGVSRIGAETLMCQTCHSTSAVPQDIEHAAPRVGMSWRLAPPEAHWFDQSSVQICEQLKNPSTNGGRSFMQLAEHLDHDLILHWAWAPGPGREPAPFSLQEHIDDILIWGVAGMPCPGS